MLDPRLNEKINFYYAYLGDIGYRIALNIQLGKDYTDRQQALYKKGVKIRSLLKVLARYTDTSVSPPRLWRITEALVNRIIKALDELTKFDRIPIVPKLLPSCKPFIINKGKDGKDGKDGADASLAAFVVEPKPGETDVTVDTEIVGNTKYFKIGFDPYTLPKISVNVSGGTVFMVGNTAPSLTINIVTTKGSNNITSLILSDTDLNAVLQGTLNFPTINGNTQPVTNFVTDTDLIADKNYLATVNDGISNMSASANVNFYYPILYGNATTILSTTHFGVLNKLVVPKSVTSIPLNGVNQYFYICVPHSYGDITIKDQNSFNVTSLFTKTTITISSSGLDHDWSISYDVYRTTAKTDINNYNYSIQYLS